MTTLLAPFALVFLAELGDKTQLVALGLGARHRLGPVLVGMFIGYGVANLVSVTIGGLLGAALPTRPIGLAGGAVFLLFAIWAVRSGPDDDEAEPAGVRGRIVFSVAIAMFVAELGDKTMLTTATLAAQGDPALVWVGATAGIVASGSIGVLVGRASGTRLPERVIRVGSALLFGVFGAVLVATNL